jgi:sulfate permease, SulP family
VSDAAILPNAFFRSINMWARTPLARSLVSGAVVGIFSILFYLSYAALIFSGPLTPWLGYGIAATFITGAIGGAAMALRSSLPFAIGGPDGSTSAVTAALVAALGAHMAAGSAERDLLTATMVALALSSALTGLLLCGLGLARAGRAIRFIPYPVIGGFLGASGCMMLLGAVQVLTGTRLQLANLDYFLQIGSTEKLLAGLAVAAFLLLGRVYWKTPFAMPAQLLASIFIFYLALFLLGVPLADAQAGGWMFTVPGPAKLAPPWTLELPHFPWLALPELAADFFAVMFVTVISVLLNITGVELATKHEANLDRELNVLGAANLLCAALGGYVACITLTRSNMNFALGKNSRVAGLAIAAMSAAALLVNPGFIDYMPKCVLGGLLLTIGHDSFRRWLIGGARQLARLEYLSLLAIAFIIVRWGFVPGVSIGVIFGCATFALSAGRINGIKFAFDGTEYRSSLDRGPRELALLGAHGDELQGLCLQSYLFFGSANRLYEHVKALLVEQPQCRFLLFDFKLVTGVDSSATHSFSQIKQAADALGARLVLVNLSPALTSAFGNINFISRDMLVIPELDRALEACETAIIAAHSDADNETRSLRDWLAEALGNAEHAELLAMECKRLEFDAGEVVAHQGAAADSMHFILEGRVGIIVKLDDGRSVRVRSLGRHTTIGEMGLITGRPRSATVQAEIASVAYELRADAFERLKAERPALAQALFTFVIGVMAERLSFASRVIGVLQR